MDIRWLKKFDNKKIVLLGYGLEGKSTYQLLKRYCGSAELQIMDRNSDYVTQCFEQRDMPYIYSELHKNILESFNEAGVEILSPSYMAARDGSLSTVPSQSKPGDKSPINKLVDHLTGRDQKVSISKPDDQN